MTAVTPPDPPPAPLPDAPPSREPRWGLGDAAIGFVAGIVISNVLASIWVAAHPEDADISLGGQGLATVGLWVGLVGATVLASYRKGARSLRDDFGFAFRPIDAVIGGVAGVASQLVLLPAIALLLRPFVGQPEVSRHTEQTLDTATGIGLVVLVLVVVVGAAVVEELFFRGLLLRSLERRFGTAWAIAGSSVMFGLAHPQALPANALVLVMISLSALGAVLALLAVRTGRLGPSIACHATFNLWTVVALLLKK